LQHLLGGVNSLGLFDLTGSGVSTPTKSTNGHMQQTQDVKDLEIARLREELQQVRYVKEM
jgi:hypothetical protein